MYVGVSLICACCWVDESELYNAGALIFHDIGERSAMLDVNLLHGARHGVGDPAPTYYVGDQREYRLRGRALRL